MKIKELKRTVNMCWSPAEHYPITIAAGSAAQQVDASFSSSSYLELYSLNLEDSGSDLELKSSFQTEQKFQKIVWSGSEIIIGGCDGGLLQFYSSDKLLNNSSECLIGSSTKHSGNVSALDINPYQKNLLASGASESEIFIWDLNNTSQPMAPGNRSQPYDHVQGLAWNQQVQHILGSTFATRCVVWDLRKNEPIMKLSDSQSRTRWRSLAWHPSVATQLCIASEDDQVPVIQLWDLRLAASPLVTLEGHQKGVMSLSWCKQDPDLMLSAGKDGRVLCWNPNDTKPGGSLVSEVSQQQQWVFEVSWSPRDPALLAACSFDQQLNIYSLLGGSKPETSTQSASNIMDSFGGEDSFSQLPAVSRAPRPPPPRPHPPARPPRWLRRPGGGKFAFGGKLVTFDASPQEAGSQKLVYISQVVSEPEVVEKSAELDALIETTLSQEPDALEKLAEYCRLRGDAASDQTDRFTWFFLRASFLPDFKAEMLNLLGFKQDEIPSKFKSPAIGDTITQPEPVGLSRGESTETEAELSTDTSTDLSTLDHPKPLPAGTEASWKKSPFRSPEGGFRISCKDAQTLIERKLSNLDIESNVSNVVIPNGEDTTSLICRALVCGNIEEAVELCLDAKRITDALIIASLGSPELVQKVQQYHLARTASDPVSLVAGSVARARWGALVAAVARPCWRPALAALLAHAGGAPLAHYAELLGDRLCGEGEAGAGVACYLVGMCADAALAAAGRGRARGAAREREEAELALLARRAAALRGTHLQEGGAVEQAVCRYAERLAAQGCVRTALAALQPLARAPLRDRLLPLAPAAAPAPARQQQQQQQQPYGVRTRTTSSHSHHKGQFSNNTYNQDPRYDQTWMSQTPQSGWPAQPQPPTLPPTQPQQPQQPLQPLQPTPPQPPRPGSVGPHGGITSRSKYKVDPSVQSPPQYNQYSYNNPISSQPSYGYNSPLPDQYQNSSVPNTFAPINPVNPGLNPANPGLNPANPGLNPVNPGLNPINPGTNQTVNGSYYTPQPVDPAMQAVPTPYKPMAAGWNDPPMVSSNKSKPPAPAGDMSARHAGTRRWGRAIHSRAHRQPKQEIQSQAPITHPLFGVEPPQHVPLTPVSGQQYPGQQYPGQQYPGQQYTGQQYQEQQNPGQQYPGQYEQQYQQPYQQQGPPQSYQQPAERAAEPPQPPKPPLPPQLAAIQTTFDALHAACCERATNPQIKRKLDDVQRRLETLYDMLRENKLSESGVQTLQSCAAAAAGGAAGAALAAATALAAGADFASAAAFLPGLKVLLQLADLQPRS